MPTTRQVPSHFRRHPLVAAPYAPLAHQQGDTPRGRRAVVAPLAAGLLLAVGCGTGGAARGGHAPSSGPASGPASAPASQPASRPARLDVPLTRTTTLSAQRLREHVFYLASDELEGRGPATAGLDKASAYLTKALRQAGLRPAFDRSYRQPFEMLVGVDRGPGNRLIQGKRTFALGPDYLPYTFSSVGTAEGAPVFAGFGIRSEDHGYDDYAGLDVQGKVVVVLDAEPGDDDPKSPFDGRRRTSHASVRSKLLLAREAGAVGLLVVVPKLAPDRPGPVAKDAGLFVAAISEKAASALLGVDVRTARAQIDDDYTPRSEDPGRPAVKVVVDLVRKRRTVHNIAGECGPEDAAEVVVMGAHYDHLGMGGAGSLSGVTEPRIHNGADDNASGTSVVLEVAQALAAEAQTYRRRVIFVLFAGEEDGLLGSSHFVEHPPVGVESMVAMVNLDMVGRLRSNKLNFMGTKTATELEALAREAAEGRGLAGTYGGDGYGPSDHTPFYARRVPVLFLFTGAHEHYHKPSDDPDTLNYPGMARVGAIAGDIVSALARSATRPSYVEAPRPAPVAGAGGGGGYGPYFGSIPDFGDDVDGVKFAGIRAGSPADEAGARKGDVLVEFNGIAVQNLQDFTIALRRSAPGDTVTIKVMRGEKILELKATLTRRQ